MKHEFEIDLTPKQAEKLKPLFEKAQTAYNNGKMGMILGQPDYMYSSEKITVRFAFIEENIASQITNLVSPITY